MNQTSKGFNYIKWSFVLAILGIIAAVTIPEIRCGLGLRSDTCSTLQKEVEIITQSETGEPLAAVKIQVIAKGAPENQYTDSNGYFKLNIASKGDVRVLLSKSGYPTQDFFINLANDQGTVRIIRLSKSGQPEVSSASTIPLVSKSGQPEISSAPVIASSNPLKEIDWNETASDIARKVNQDFTYTCPPNGTINNLWGTDFYTSGSSICSAAVHAGIITTKDGGTVSLRILPGEKFYNGTARNGVKSERYGNYDGSFTFLNSTGSPIAKEQIQLIEWNDTASNLQGKLDQDFTYMCRENGTIENVWGTDIYTIYSSICSSAVHAGVIKAKTGGEIKIKISPGEKFYNGTTRNGVKSEGYNSSSWSFKIIK